MLYHHLQKMHLTRLEKSAIIKDLANGFCPGRKKSFVIKDLANPLILLGKIFSLKINNLAETAFLRQCESDKVTKLHARARRL